MSRVRTVVAWALVVVWLVATVLGVRNAVVESTYADLRAGLDSGEITEVVVVGDVSPPGRGTVEVQWDGFPADHYASVRAVGRRDDVRAMRQWGPVLQAPVVETLREEYPDLVVTTSDRFALDRVGFWQPALAIGAALWTVLLVITTPGPLRATRWAWFWIIGILPPAGPIAFLLLGGPTGLVKEKPGTQPMTGGWAFLIAAVINSALGTLFGFALAGTLQVNL
jgi:hypothetical protein